MLANSEPKNPKLRYAQKATVARTIEAARTAGVEIAAVELAANGTIRLFTDKLPPDGHLSEFDRLDALGKL